MTTHLIAALVCDDVRHENTGKQIIIGVYGRDIVFPTFPAAIVLTLWMRFRFDGTAPRTLEFLVDGPSGSILPTVGIEPPTAPEGEFFDLSLGGIIVRPERPGRITFRWREDGKEEWQDAVALNAVQGAVNAPVKVAVPIASPLPASPAQPASPESSSPPEPSPPKRPTRRRRSVF